MAKLDTPYSLGYARFLSTEQQVPFSHSYQHNEEILETEVDLDVGTCLKLILYSNGSETFVDDSVREIVEKSSSNGVYSYKLAVISSLWMNVETPVSLAPMLAPQVARVFHFDTPCDSVCLMAETEEHDAESYTFNKDGVDVVTVATPYTTVQQTGTADWKVKANGNGTTTTDSDYCDAETVSMTLSRSLTKLVAPTINVLPVKIGVTRSISFLNLYIQNDTIILTVHSVPEEWNVGDKVTLDSYPLILEIVSIQETYISLRIVDYGEYDKTIVEDLEIHTTGTIVPWNIASGEAGYAVITENTVDNPVLDAQMLQVFARGTTTQIKAFDNQRVGVFTLPQGSYDITARFVSSDVSTIDHSNESNSIHIQFGSTPSGGNVMAEIFRNLTGLSNGTTYEFRITAIGDGTNYTDSAPSSVDNFTTLIPLAAPEGLTLTKTTSSITATWNAVANAGNAANSASYRVAYVTGNGSWTEVDVSGTSYTLSNIAQGATYDFKVMALGNGTVYEDSAYCTAVSETVLIKLATPAPTVDSTTSQVSVAWAAVANASGYKVAYKTGSGAYGEAIDVGTNLTYAVTGLQEGVQITFKVQAYTATPNIYEDSELSAEVTETTQITLGVPAFTLSKTTDSITATWSAVENAASYTVAYKLNGASGDFTEVPVAEGLTYTLGSLAEGVTYDFKIKAVSNVQDYVDSAYSASQSETTLITLATPSSIVVSDITSTSAKVAWAQVANASGYKIEYRVAGSDDEWTEIN